MKKILLLTDFSEASKHALDFARSFFGDTVADFHLLCVYPLEPDGFRSPMHGTKTAHAAYAEPLNDMVMELRRQVTTDWHTFRSSACPGPVLEVVEKSLDMETYDFVIVGAKKDGTNELFGNSAIGLTRQLKANVLVVPVDALAKQIRGVALAADFANLKNSKLLGPIKELVILKSATLTLLTIDTPTKKTIQAEQEIHIRKFLKPIEPTIARLKAPAVRQGIDKYLASHPFDLLVMIPQYRKWVDASFINAETQARAYTPAVPLITLYDDNSSDRPLLIEDLSNADQAL